MKKIYTIQITGHHSRNGIWYASKVGCYYEVELSKGRFQVLNSRHHVHPIDCKVISERVEEIYQKAEKYQE